MVSKLLQIAFFMCAALFTLAAARGPPTPYLCDRQLAAFATRHAFHIGAEQANRASGALWKQNVAVIAQVNTDPQNPSVLQWIEVANFDFWQDNYWADDACAWNETQAWPRVDPVTNEFVLALQRIMISPIPVYTRTDFSTAPPTVQESESEYTTAWARNAYLEESAIVIGAQPYEYALGPKTVSAGWYTASGKLNYVNTLFNYVDGYYRTYTLNTILEAVAGDPTTQYKVLADITSTNVAVPPELVTAAFEWFHQVIEDDTYVPVVNPNTGIGEYIFVPSQHMPAAKRAAASMPVNTSPSVNFHSHEAVQKAIQDFADSI